ncbi:MAG: DUF3817 domain-containing protein [Propioniciclava sp.]
MSISLDTTPVQPGEVPAIRSALVRYRVMAWIVGVLLIVLVGIGMPLKYLADNGIVVASVGTAHGWLYMILLITAYDLGRRVRWPWSRLLLIALGGTVPFMSFVAEHYATADVRRRVSQVQASTPTEP